MDAEHIRRKLELLGCSIVDRNSFGLIYRLGIGEFKLIKETTNRATNKKEISETDIFDTYGISDNFIITCNSRLRKMGLYVKYKKNSVIKDYNLFTPYVHKFGSSPCTTYNVPPGQELVTILTPDDETWVVNHYGDKIKLGIKGSTGIPVVADYSKEENAYLFQYNKHLLIISTDLKFMQTIQ